MNLIPPIAARAILPAVLLVGGCAPSTLPDPSTTWHGATMGTTWQVTVPVLPKGLDRSVVRQRIATRLEHIESQMSHWRDDSDVSQFNRNQTVRPQPISPELADVVREGIQVYRQTEGAFDITAAPLTDLWGFGPKNRDRRAPNDLEIQQAREHVSSDQLILDDSQPENPQLGKQDPRIQLDLSAIAKGYAIDSVAKLLETLTISDYLVEIGGELRGRGCPPGKRAWRVGLESPDAATVGQIRRTITLADRAVATSGSYRLFKPRRQGKGQVDSHLLDPRSGYPIRNGVRSVSVIAESAMRADALATAILVLGPQQGFAFASQSKIAATIVYEEGPQLVERETEEFTIQSQLGAKQE